jgi:hypothetical protein
MSMRDAAMAERLANVIYWLGCIFAVLFLLIGSAAGVSRIILGNEEADFVLIIILVTFAAASYGLGWAVRLVSHRVV